MKLRAYVETTIPSCLTAWPSRDAVLGIELLVTWNCRHIANSVLRPRVEAVCRAAGYEPPSICTPAELLGGDDDAGTDVLADIRAVGDELAGRHSGDALSRDRGRRAVSSYASRRGYRPVQKLQYSRQAPHRGPKPWSNRQLV